jgi:hypothetical protein
MITFIGSLNLKSAETLNVIRVTLPVFYFFSKRSSFCSLKGYLLYLFITITKVK